MALLHEGTHHCLTTIYTRTPLLCKHRVALHTRMSPLALTPARGRRCPAILPGKRCLGTPSDTSSVLARWRWLGLKKRSVLKHTSNVPAPNWVIQAGNHASHLQGCLFAHFLHDHQVSCHYGAGAAVRDSVHRRFFCHCGRVHAWRQKAVVLSGCAAEGVDCRRCGVCAHL